MVPAASLPPAAATCSLGGLHVALPARSGMDAYTWQHAASRGTGHRLPLAVTLLVGLRRREPARRPGIVRLESRNACPVRRGLRPAAPGRLGTCNPSYFEGDLFLGQCQQYRGE